VPPPPAPAPPTPTASDHLSPSDADYPDGVYRVVGVPDDRVTLLRVGDADGRRVHTGELVVVARDDLDGFEPAAPPTERRSPGAAVASAASTAYWSLRAFGRQLAANPVPAGVSTALFLGGVVGARLLPRADLATGALLLAGSLGLAYVGSGRAS
jgi:hypothetical protein